MSRSTIINKLKDMQREFELKHGYRADTLHVTRYEYFKLKQTEAEMWERGLRARINPFVIREWFMGLRVVTEEEDL